MLLVSLFYYLSALLKKKQAAKGKELLMISYISGDIAFKSPAFVIIESGGIGYRLNISLNTWSKIQTLKTCKLYTHLNVKSENQSVSGFELFGFADESEKELFELLLSVSGIGANMARMALSSLSPEEVKQGILTDNVAMIQSVKGIGEKTAKRLILELKDKIGKVEVEQSQSSASPEYLKVEALSALVSLGFNKNLAEKALNGILVKNGEISSVEELIKKTLKSL